MKEIQQILDKMEPEEALAELTPLIKSILGHIDEEARVRFVTDMIDETGEDKIGSMVSL
jgi:hypothetical protein